MAFKGAVGVTIVIVSLFASAILGVLINVNQEDVLKDVDHYQSDITGLFSSSKDKSYAEYNTAKNFNGYTSSNTSTFPVDFRESLTANNYPFSYYSVESIPKNTTLSTYPSTTVSDKYSVYNDFGINTTAPYFTGWQSSQNTYNRIQLDDLIQTEMNYATTTYGSVPESLSISIPFDKLSRTAIQSPFTVYYPNNWATFMPNLYIGTGTMQNMVNNTNSLPPQYIYSALTSGSLKNIICEYNTATDTCLLDFGSGMVVTNVDPSLYSIIYVSGGNFSGTIYSGNEAIGTPINPYTYINMDMADAYNYFHDTTKYVKIGSSVTLSPYYEYPWSFDADTVDSGYGLSITGGSITGVITGNEGDVVNFSVYGFNEESEDWTTWYGSFTLTNNAPIITETVTVSENTNNLHIEYNYSKIVSYMDARYGISARPGETVTWSNDYANGYMDIVVYMDSPDRTYYNKWDFIYPSTLPSPVTYADKNSIEMIHTAGGDTIVTLTSYEGAVPNIQQTNVGADWVAFNLHIDAVTGKVIAQPIASSDWTNFQNWRASSDIDLGTFSLTGDINYMQIFGDTDSYPFNFQVASTSVFLNTYGIIKIDSSINILKWYPNNDHYKMKFSKTSAVGSSVLIGSDLYTISNDRITVNDTEIDVKDMVLEYERADDQWTVTISSAKTGNSAEIITPFTNIGLNGAWYFTCEYFTVSEELVKENVWEPIKGVAYGYSGIILITLILNVVIGIGIWKFAPDLMEFPDIVILIGAEILLFIILA